MSQPVSLEKVWAGWSEIFVGRQSYADHFDFSPAGLNAAHVVYLIASFGLAALQMALAGFPPPLVALSQLLAFLAPLLSLYLVTYGAKASGVLPSDPIHVIVPGIYMHATLLVFATLSAIVGLNISGIVIGLTAYFLYRLSRVAGRMSPGWSIMFAVANVVALVALTTALYMLAMRLTPAT